MADFLTNLWESVFTPGTTPTLLIATNVTFAALQLLLAALLFMTSSIHFAILSVLSGSLWYAINWFARELHAAQEKETEAKRLRKNMSSNKSEMIRHTDDEGDDTEVETSGTKIRREGSGIKSRPTPNLDRETTVTASGQHSQSAPGPRRRLVDDESRSGDVSTDSEWEKVDGD